MVVLTIHNTFIYSLIDIAASSDLGNPTARCTSYHVIYADICSPDRPSVSALSLNTRPRYLCLVVASFSFVFCYAQEVSYCCRVSFADLLEVQIAAAVAGFSWL